MWVVNIRKDDSWMIECPGDIEAATRTSTQLSCSGADTGGSRDHEWVLTPVALCTLSPSCETKKEN